MDQATFALCVLIGSLLGHVAGRFIPRQRHDARAVVLLAAVCGSIAGGWLLAQTGAPDALALLGALVLATALAGAVATAGRRPPVDRRRRSPRTHSVRALDASHRRRDPAAVDWGRARTPVRWGPVPRGSGRSADLERE